MSHKKSNATGLGCLLLFALPFAGVGVFMGGRALWSLVEWAEMRSWVEVDAQIETLSLDTNTGDDSTSYEVKATYRYDYRGISYQGDRVALHTGSDGVGEFQRNTHAELSSYQGRRFRAFVNPDDPSRSVLYRDLRWEMIGFHFLFFLVFGGVGFGIMVAGLWGYKKLKRDEELQARYPGEPWLHKEEWQSGRIRSSSRRTLVFSLVFATFWNLVSAPTLFLLYEAIQGKREPIVFVAGLFPLVGIGLVYWAFRNFLRYRKFGESVFEMQYMPGVIGGPFAGTLRTKATGAVFDVTLSSIHKHRSGKGKSRSTSERVLWQRKARFPFDRARDGVSISFQVPFDCAPTDAADTNDQKLWKLTVDSEADGIDYHAAFEVPVFRTEHSSEQPLEEVSSERAAPIEQSLDLALKKSGVRVERLAGATRWVFPMARRLGAAVSLSAFFVGWTALCVFLWRSDAPAIFPWLFGVFDLLLLFGVLDLWFHASRIEARHGRLSFASGLFGGRLRSVAGSDVASVKARRGMQSGNQLYYQLELCERGGKTHTLAKRLPDLDTAERLAGEIRARLGRVDVGAQESEGLLARSRI